MQKEIKIYFPNKINAEYSWNKKYDRFNCPWENKLLIEGEHITDSSIEIDTYLETAHLTSSEVDKIIGEIINFYEKQQNNITIGIKHIQHLEIIISDKSLEQTLIDWKEFDSLKILNDIFQRGITVPNNLRCRIFVSTEGCKGTIWRDEKEFKKKYPEYYQRKPWTLKGFIYYVLAHEFGHVMIPLEEEKGGEIFPIILGSKFAAENNYIYVPQGRELKRAWGTVGIILDRETPERDYLLARCKNWLEGLPGHLNYLRE